MAKNLKLEVLSDLDLVVREVPTARVLEMSVSAPEALTSRERPRMNLALVIDRSGSMSGEKLNYVKDAALYVLGMLQEQDRLTVVTYDTSVETLCAGEPVNSQNRDVMGGRIRALQTGDMTNLSGGWLQGCKEVAAAAGEGYLNRVLLLTDGLANQGITDMEELGHHASQLQQRGVATSTFGVGDGFNEHLLEHMANQGGGNFHFIEHPQAIPQIFMKELKEMAAVTARNVELDVSVPPQVETRVPGGWKTEWVEGRLRITVGDMAAGQVRQVYLKLLTPPQGTADHLTFHVVARAMGEAGELYEQAGEMLYRYAPQAEVQAAQPRQDVLQRFGIVEVADVATQALKLEREGKGPQASQMLTRAMEANASYLPESTVAEYSRLSERMKKGLSEIDRKSTHFALYAAKQTRKR